MNFVKKYLPVIVALGLVLIVTILSLSYGGQIVDFFKGAGDKATTFISSTEEMEFNQYNDQLVSGSHVLQASKNYKNSVDVGIRIVNAGSTSPMFFAENTSGAAPYYEIPTSGTTVGNKVTPTASAIISTLTMGKVSSQYYVNPNATYKSSVYLNSAGKVVLLAFVQQ